MAYLGVGGGCRGLGSPLIKTHQWWLQNMYSWSPPQRFYKSDIFFFFDPDQRRRIGKGGVKCKKKWVTRCPILFFGFESYLLSFCDCLDLYQMSVVNRVLVSSCYLNYIGKWTALWLPAVCIRHLLVSGWDGMHCFLYDFWSYYSSVEHSGVLMSLLHSSLQQLL